MLTALATLLTLRPQALSIAESDEFLQDLQSYGTRTGIKVNGKWFTSASAHPIVKVENGRMVVSGIDYGPPALPVHETWTFAGKNQHLHWKIDRQYLKAGTLEDTAMPMFSAPNLTTWTGALLGTGGVAWCKLFDKPNATFGVHTSSARFWNPELKKTFGVQVIESDPSQIAMRFTREPSGQFSLSTSVTQDVRTPNHDKAHYLKDRQDIWKPFSVTAGETATVTVDLTRTGYSERFGRGDFKGLDTTAITEMINTIGRIGVIDNDLVGTNGWYSGYICLHEPWIAMIGATLDDPNYLKTNARWLDYARENAVKPDGMVMSRWWYYNGDAQPGTYDPKTGFYEAQWGRLMDSQTCYATNIADQFDLTGDMVWLKRQKSSAEAALEYLLKRDSNQNHLVEMQNSLTSQRKSSDWLDIVWASHENALVNGQMYGALQKWARLERLLGDEAKATYYKEYAHDLKVSFNKPISEGGFWNPDKGWYVYWRDADNSTHGDNLVIPVNLTAIGEGICDDPARKAQLLDTIEKRMNAESLLAWPACFEGYKPGEGMDDHFPTYENGDIFLSWCEYGVRAYAETHPEIALKYVHRIVDQYKKDGLAFQRYLRSNGQGAGDDILAGNFSVINGLYRDIYGIQPKYNHLYLEPHLMPELNGTNVIYSYRGHTLDVELSVGDYTVHNNGMSVHSGEPFGVSFSSNEATYFPGSSDHPAFTVRHGETPLRISVLDWKDRAWSIQGGAKSAKFLHTFQDLPSGQEFAVMAQGRRVATVSETHRSVSLLVRARRKSSFRLVPIRV